MASMQKLLAKSATPFRQVLQGAISRRTDNASDSKRKVLPRSSEPAFVTIDSAPIPAAPKLIARAAEPEKVLAPVLAVPQTSSPFTTIQSIVESARRQALMMSYENEIMSYPDIPMF